MHYVNSCDNCKFKLWRSCSLWRDPDQELIEVDENQVCSYWKDGEIRGNRLILLEVELNKQVIDKLDPSDIVRIRNEAD